MGVRPGYKQTEVGVIPEAWAVVPVGDLFTFKNGLNKAKQFFGCGTPIVNYMDVFGKPSLRIGEVSRPGRRERFQNTELNAYNVRKGDVFFTRTSETVEDRHRIRDARRTRKHGIQRFRSTGAPKSNDSLDDTFKTYCFSPRVFPETNQRPGHATDSGSKWSVSVCGPAGTATAS